MASSHYKTSDNASISSTIRWWAYSLHKTLPYTLQNDVDRLLGRDDIGPVQGLLQEELNIDIERQVWLYSPAERL